MTVATPPERPLLRPGQPAVEAAVVAFAIARGVETRRKIMFRTAAFTDVHTAIRTALYARSLSEDTVYQVVNLTAQYSFDGTTLDDGADVSFVGSDSDLAFVVTIKAEASYDEHSMTSHVVAQAETVKEDVDRQVKQLLKNVRPHSVLMVYVLDEATAPTAT